MPLKDQRLCRFSLW